MANIWHSSILFASFPSGFRGMLEPSLIGKHAFYQNFNGSKNVTNKEEEESIKSRNHQMDNEIQKMAHNSFFCYSFGNKALTCSYTHTRK
ncbi:GTP-binding protein [Dirofilaria immitis]